MSHLRIIRTGLLLFLSILGLEVLAQPRDTNSYLRNYFRHPLNIPMQLSANFGELRPNHWHMGLDIRTYAKEDQPVYAAAEGYVTKVGIRPQSFGRYIIINHPNGLSTLYAHLNDFNTALEEYVTAQQYKQESWAVELDFTKDQFPLSKGAFIAYSGNTGGSKGPHLHFEIIDTKTDKRLNPLLFNFPMEDNMPPSIIRLAMYNRSKTVYAQTPVFFALKNTDSGYIIPKKPVIKTGLSKVSFAIQAFDKMNGGGSDNGIFSAKLYVDDEPQISFVLDSIDYNETVYINSHTDYRNSLSLQHLSQLPGDHCPIYKKINGDGVINFSDTNVHFISIDVKDPKGNTSQLNFAMQYDDSLAKTDVYQSYVSKFAPDKLNVLTKEDFKMKLPEYALYDTVPALYYRNNSSSYNAVTALHQVNDATYPVHEDISVSIKPNKTIPEEWKDKLLMQRTGKGSTIRKVTLQEGWLSATFGDFGSFQVLADVTPPQINDPGSYRGGIPARPAGGGDTINLSAASRIVFTPTDNFGIVKKFRVELDSQWLRFTNDKSRNWIYKFDDRCPYGVHQLTATATDLVGNTTTKTWWFKRYPYTPPPPKKKTVKKGSGKKQVVNGVKKKAATAKKTTTKKKK
ncbi:MAG: peptidoglycan DD-metalloendopeptidase family protein [Bacteroidota bacterium]|nr:peptidoglycan DD-metalloendopeptidase family protein [Bacteroidota bacterium]